MIDLNALLRRPVEYYEYPWAIERQLLNAQSFARSLFQAGDVTFIFAKSMPRSGHRFITECLEHYFGDALAYCGFYNLPSCCGKIPCAVPHNAGKSNRFFMQKSHDFGFRDSKRLRGKYLIQYRSPIPRLQSNFDLFITRETGEQSPESFRAFAEKETTYFINFYRKWVARERPNLLAIAYEDLIEQQELMLIAAISFIQGHSSIDRLALERALAQTPVAAKSSMSGEVRDPRQYPYYDPDLFAALERKVAEACGTDRIRFHFI